MFIGPYVNGAAVIIGGLAGAFFGTRIPLRLRTALPQVFGLCAMGLGISLIIGAKYLAAVVLALILGTILGELLYFERGISQVATRARGYVERYLPSVDGLSQKEFLEQFVAIIVLFCASGMGIFGAMHEGMTGDPSVLYIKAILDLFTAAIFAAALGYAVAFIAVPLILVQLILALLASFILPLATPAMMADFSCVGGLIMLATGLRICAIKSFQVANMLPALLLVMPLSYWWANFMA